MFCAPPLPFDTAVCNLSLIEQYANGCRKVPEKLFAEEKMAQMKIRMMISLLQEHDKNVYD